MSIHDFHSRSTPHLDYSQTTASIQTMQVQEKDQPGFNPALQTILLTHGKRTRRVVVWFHGYTAATRQFKELGEACFEAGYNVLVPCVPHHGFTDRMSPEVSRLDTLELVRFSDRMVDLAAGLGDEVIVGGLSMGGAMSAWVAQERSDVSTVICVAPFLGARVIPANLTRLAALGATILPDFKLWWDPAKKMDLAGPNYGYLHFSTHSLVQILRLAFRTADFAAKTPPCAGSIRMVLNAHDESVNNLVAERLVSLWRHWPGLDVESYTFPDELGIPHDCISSDQPKGQPALVYRKLLELIE